LSPRDFCIYREVVIERLTQEDVARRYKVSQGRVSQIVARVQQALDEVQPPEDEALAAAREARREARECRERHEHYLTLAAEGYRQSSQPLVTVRTRQRGGEEEFQETTERPQKANVQFLKLMVKLNGEMEAGVQGSGFGVQGRKPAGGGRKEEAKTPPEPKFQSPPGYPANRDPVAQGKHSATERLSSIRAFGASLADVEVLNFICGQTDGCVYPSYFEKSDESINGVRVADWVREHVPDELLPHGEDVWLPVEHSLADFDGTDREIAEYDTSRRHFNPNQVSYHFGRRVAGEGSGFGVQGSGEQRERQREGKTERGSEGETERQSGSESGRQNVASPSAALPLAPADSPPQPPSKIERLLNSGRRISDSYRRKLTSIAARQREAQAEEHPASLNANRTAANKLPGLANPCQAMSAAVP
jgi:hypothetical protein